MKQDSPCLSDELRAELAECDLAKHAEVFLGMDVNTLDALRAIDAEVLDDLVDALRSRGAPSKTRRYLRRLRSGHSPDSRFAHFAHLHEPDWLNSSETSGLAAATVIKVDVWHANDVQELHEVFVPPGVVDSQVRAAGRDSTQIVSLLGPTGAGKSFIASSFMERAAPKSVRPLVASPGQVVPTSCNVCLYRGVLQPDSQPPTRTPLMLFDFEGEDGRTPRTLTQFLLRPTEAARERQRVVKELFPSLGYLLSDVVVFIDTVEPRREERIQRIRHFAEVAHKAVQSTGWHPALLLVQNKWTRDPREEVLFDVTEMYDWIVDSLSPVFSHVKVLRIPPASDASFARSLYELHNALDSTLQRVRSQRDGARCLYSEREFWFSFTPMVEQLGQLSVEQDHDLQSLTDTVLAMRSSANPPGNALRALTKLGPLPSDPKEFYRRLDHVLVWYAYAIAGTARVQDSGGQRSTREGLQAQYEEIMEICRAMEPCGSFLEHESTKYPCTQRRAGHPCEHRNPAMIRRPTEHLLRRVLSLGLWQDEVPCVWLDGEGFKSADRFLTFSLEKFEKSFEEYVKMDDVEYARAFPRGDGSLAPAARGEGTIDEHDDMCLLCLRAGQDVEPLVVLPNPYCLHALCNKCKMTYTSKADEVVCPFCSRKSKLVSGTLGACLRILSLDGGGVRGLVEVRVLRKLEELFAPLRITSLFDLIVGTSAGGIIAMALLSKVPLERVEDLLKNLAADILDKKSWVNLLTPHGMCDSSKLDSALQSLFGKTTHLLSFPAPESPYVYCTAFKMNTQAIELVGNHKVSGVGTVSRARCWEAARMTAAAPMYFSPFKRTAREAGDIAYVDGGVRANCPAKLAVNLANALATDSRASAAGGRCVVEIIASIGTGREAPAVVVPEPSALWWLHKIIASALDAEEAWAEVDAAAELKEVPKVRVSPPTLGSLSAFDSASIPKLDQGMDEYFKSAEGQKQMDTLVHLVFAKLWEVKCDTNLIVGTSTKLCITMRERCCDFNSMNPEDLQNIISRREASSTTEKSVATSMRPDELRQCARDAFMTTPFVPQVEGHFEAAVGAEHFKLPRDSYSFPVLVQSAGDVQLNISWVSNHGDRFSISGCPRRLTVLDSTFRRAD